MAPDYRRQQMCHPQGAGGMSDSSGVELRWLRTPHAFTEIQEELAQLTRGIDAPRLAQRAY